MDQKKEDTKKRLNLGKTISEKLDTKYYNTLIDLLNKNQTITDEQRQVFIEEYTNAGDILKEKRKVLEAILPLLGVSYLGFLKLANDKQTQKAPSTVLKIDNYQDNVTRFYEQQPFFYDKSGMFWFWSEDHYEQVDEVDVMIMLDKELGFAGQTVNSKLKSQYLEAFKRVGRVKMPKEAPDKWIQFKDKAFSLKSGKLYEVEPNYFFTNPIPWEMGVDDQTPVMDRLITEWVGEKYLCTAYEIIAYCCLRSYPIHLIFTLVGCGRNGKSKFIGLLNKFIGNENVCSTELDTLLNSRFESFKLYKKLVCSMGETNFGILAQTSLLKKLCGQDLIGFEFKNKKPFDDYNYAKIIISSNSLPTSTDTSEGFYRRWLILEFNNIFPEGKDILKQIPEQEYNNLANKVTKILPKLLENGEFSNQGTIEERKARYIMSSNPLPFFVTHFCKKDDNGYVQYNVLYQAYINFLRDNKKRKVSRKEFKAALEDEGFFVEKGDRKMSEFEIKSGYWIDGLIFVEKTDKTDKTATIPTQNPLKGNQCEKLSVLSVLSVNEEIHQKCSICSTETSHHWLNNGKPVCHGCYLSLKANDVITDQEDIL